MQKPCHWYVSGSQAVEISPVEAADVLKALCNLQLNGYSHFKLGHLRVSIRLKGKKPGERRFNEFELLWEQLFRDKDRFEQEKNKFESTLKAQIAHEKSEIESNRQELREKTSILHQLKTRLQSLLQDPKPSPRLKIGFMDCEESLNTLRTEAASLQAQGTDLNPVKRELDLVEDLFVCVQNGEEEGGFRNQVEVVKKAFLYAKAQRVVSETEKLTQSIGSSLRVLHTDVSFHKSKANILRRVLERVSPCASSLSRSPDLSFENRRLPTTSLPSPCARNTGEVEKWQKKAADLSEKVARFEAAEEEFILEKGQVKGEAQELALKKAAVSRREEELAEREIELTVLEDRLRASLSRVLSKSEAREFLRLKAAELAHERRLLQIKSAEFNDQLACLQAQEVAFAEQKRVFDRRLRKATHEISQNKRLREVCKEIETALNKI